jgi:hypothetical protein
MHVVMSHYRAFPQAAERHHYDAPVLALVLKQLRHIETTLFPDLAHLAAAAKASAPGNTHWCRECDSYAVASAT